MRFPIAFVIIALLSGLFLPPTPPAEPQAFPTIQLMQVATGFSAPVDITNAGDGSGRLFIVEQAGLIRILKNGNIAGTFLDIKDRVLFSSEQGLLSVAFPPGYGSTIDHFFVYYTTKNGDNLLEGLQASAAGRIPAKGPRGGARWTPSYFVRRTAWHVLDHAWEIEDRLS